MFTHRSQSKASRLEIDTFYWATPFYYGVSRVDGLGLWERPVGSLLTLTQGSAPNHYNTPPPTINHSLIYCLLLIKSPNTCETHQYNPDINHYLQYQPLCAAIHHHPLSTVVTTQATSSIKASWFITQSQVFERAYDMQNGMHCLL